MTSITMKTKTALITGIRIKTKSALVTGVNSQN